MEGDGGDGQFDGCAEGKSGRTGRTPIREARTDREAGRENSLKVGRKSETEFSLGHGKLGFGETGLNRDAGAFEVRDKFVG